MHIIQGDLILHKRTLEPIKTVVYGLRRYDDDRVAAMSEKVDPTMKIQGYMSHKAKIYLVRAFIPLRWPRTFSLGHPACCRGTQGDRLLGTLRSRIRMACEASVGAHSVARGLD